MEFTAANQKGNQPVWTTCQTIEHDLYKNSEVSISGMGEVYTVWHKFGHRISQVGKDLNLEDAVIFANEYIKSI